MASCRQGNTRLEVDLQDLSVEITDPEVFKKLRFSPVLKTDPLFPKHEDVINATFRGVDLAGVMSVGKLEARNKFR